MMTKKHLKIASLLIGLFLMSCQTKKLEATALQPKYEIEDRLLFDAIVAMDKTFFEAYNTCNMEKQAEIYADEIEFFHDKGGLMTSKQELLDGTKKNICGKVTRELVAGSIEVYPIKDYGAIEIGYHKFYNNEEPDAISHPSKFIIMWQKVANEWKITKVVSLH
jgi:hypothetical protein